MLLLLALNLSSAAEPGDVRLGVELGVQSDLSDRVSADYAQFGVGPVLAVPLSVAISPYARLRTQLRAEMATGHDRVSWDVPLSTGSQRVYSDDHWAMAAMGSGSLGIEVLLPIDSPVEVAFGVETGIGWMGTYHSFSGSTSVLLDPNTNDLLDPNNVDPFTSQVVWRNAADVSVAVPMGERLHLSLRTAYAVAFIDSRPLQKSPAALDAERAAYGWNPLSVTLGLQRKW